jgi:hypothetical protein
MRTSFALLAALSLAAAAGGVAAQAPVQQPAAQPAPQPAAPQAQPEERRPLILELDETSRRQILSNTRSSETGSRGANLPGLGDDARKIDPAILRGNPFPKESYSNVPTPN